MKCETCGATYRLIGKSDLILINETTNLASDFVSKIFWCKICGSLISVAGDKITNTAKPESCVIKQSCKRG